MDFFEDIKRYTWRLVVKALPFEGGPSSTKFVYMAAAFCIMVAALFLVTILGGVYVFTHDHHVDGTIVGLIGTLMVSVAGLATNSVNQRRKVLQDTNAPDPDPPADLVKSTLVVSSTAVGPPPNNNG